MQRAAPVLVGGEVEVADDALEPAAMLRPEALHLVADERVELQRRAGAAARAGGARGRAGGGGARGRRADRRRVPVGRVALEPLAARLAAAAGPLQPISQSSPYPSTAKHS